MSKRGRQANEEKAGAKTVSVAGIGGRFRIVNSSRNIFIFPITQYVRETILPGRAWEVPDEHADQVRKCLKSKYYEVLIDKGLLQVTGAEPSKLGEAELTAPETPEAPRELTETADSVTQAGFVKNEKGK